MIGPRFASRRLFSTSLRLINFKDASGARLGVESLDGMICDMTKTNSSIPKDMISFLEAGETAKSMAREALQRGENMISASSVTRLSPIYGPEKVLCVGMNYVDHCTEQGFPVPTEPIIFNKFASAIIATGEGIINDPETEELDFEVELAVVIGKSGRKIPKEAAMDYVGGYTVAHDVSARDWQLKKNGGQWLLGKTFDTFCPLGPVMVTPEEFDFDTVHNLPIWCKLNGEYVQNSNTKELIFKIDELISWISRFVTLRPGDLILTGTGPGVGCFRTPPLWLKDGDVVECGVDGIGSITNPVIPMNCQAN